MYCGVSYHTVSIRNINFALSLAVCCQSTGMCFSCRLLHYGPNSLDVPVKPYHVLFIEEVLHPFYIFELLSVTFWMMDEYYYYAG